MYNRELPYLFNGVGSHFVIVRARALVHLAQARMRAEVEEGGAHIIAEQLQKHTLKDVGMDPEVPKSVEKQHAMRTEKIRRYCRN